MTLPNRSRSWYLGPIRAFLKRFFNPLINRLLWHNQAFNITQLEPLDVQTALSAFSQPLRCILKVRQERDFLKATYE